MGDIEIKEYREVAENLRIYQKRVGRKMLVLPIQKGGSIVADRYDKSFRESGLEFERVDIPQGGLVGGYRPITLDTTLLKAKSDDLKDYLREKKRTLENILDYAEQCKEILLFDDDANKGDSIAGGLIFVYSLVEKGLMHPECVSVFIDRDYLGIGNFTRNKILQPRTSRMGPRQLIRERHESGKELETSILNLFDDELVYFCNEEHLVSTEDLEIPKPYIMIPRKKGVKGLWNRLFGMKKIEVDKPEEPILVLYETSVQPDVRRIPNIRSYGITVEERNGNGPRKEVKGIRRKEFEKVSQAYIFVERGNLRAVWERLDELNEKMLIITKITLVDENADLYEYEFPNKCTDHLPLTYLTPTTQKS